MLKHPTEERLAALGLTGMAKALEEQRKQPDIAVGNVVGSNIFNVLGILGVGSIVSPLRAPGVSTSDQVVMIAFTLLLIPLLYTGRVLHRVEGGALLLLYGVYLFLLWPN